ncbi:Pentatricopeptide repeat-containing protein [Actinidia chinensis var. chinensis]|uniref:Pentatricopeptide repeat-containing protein n=1 Tax=Actinidia chinensis var. chinensis TaxID=1590841 RepID=A0A2R6PKR8_ACTCC|nr:Pentatricopeptide repeat-containing protein [Actinidia chinensis var. chinensis]
MLGKLQHIDTHCFHVLNSIKNSANSAVSVSPPRKIESERPNGGVKRFRRVYKKTDEPKPHLLREPGSSPNGFGTNPDGKNTRGGSGIDKKMGSVIKFRSGDGNGVVGKTHAKCSTKWLNYGGCIPAILEALETVSDLDEALRPWEESLSNKERTIILKEQSSWERALEIFEWFKRRGCFEVNVIHYNIMLRVLGKAQKWDLVESLWDEMGNRSIVPINSTYGTLIDVYSKGGLKEKALGWLELMTKQGMEPDEVTMGIVVQTYKKAGEFEMAEEFFKMWSLGKSSSDEGGTSEPTMSTTINGNSQGHVALSSYTYNTLIDTFGKAGQLKEASETFALMLKDGVVPNTVTFNTMIHICGNHGQLEEVASLMCKMEELRCSPDTRTYNILISLHAKHDDIEMAAFYFKKMKEASLEPDLVSYRTLLYAFSIRHMVGEAEDLVSEINEKGLEIDEFTQSALTRMYIEAGMLDKSWLWFKRFHLKRNMSSECYSASIDAFGERGHVVEAEKVFTSCQEYKKPSVMEFNVMIKAYGINKKFDKACQLFDSMEKHDVVPDKCSFSSLIQILASAELPHLAVIYVRKMQEAGLVSDCISYCAVISSFVKLGQLQMAEGLFAEMVGFNVRPDVIVFGVLINAFADIGSVKQALRYVDGMEEAGIPMNSVIYKSLIKLYTKVGYLKETEETFKKLQSIEVGPDRYSSNCMIDLYSERSMDKQAEYIFENLEREGHANEFSYAMMLCMYKRLGRLDKAIRIAQKMRKLGLMTDLLSYNHVLSLYASDGRFKEAVRTFKEMMESSLQPNDSTFKSLGVLLMKCGVPEQAIGEMELTRKMNAQSGLKSWVSTLCSVVSVDNYEVDGKINAFAWDRKGFYI